MPKTDNNEDDRAEDSDVVPMGDNAEAVLRRYAERIERLDEERQSMVSDIREVFAEAKAEGFDPKILRKALARRRRDPKDLYEEDSVLELYEDALKGLTRPT